MGISLSSTGCSLWQSPRQSKLTTYSKAIGFPVHSFHLQDGGAAVRMSNQRLVFSVADKKFTTIWDDELNVTRRRETVDRKVFSRMRELVPIRSLSIVGLKLGEEAWAELCRLDLRELDASLTNAVDNDVTEWITHLDGLISLDLSATKVTDECLVDASAWEGLQVIKLNDLQITDIGLEHLTRVRSLLRIEVANTLVTKEGVLRYRAAGGKADVVIEPDVRKDGGVY
jgi:hypothetical protein